MYYDEESRFRGHNQGGTAVEDAPPRIFDAQEAPRREEWHQPKIPLAPETPEAVLSEGITVRGELSFQRYLRIDGHFEGELFSEGKLHVGPNGVIKSNLNLREAIIEGRVEGNIVVQERLELRGEAQVTGNIEASQFSVDDGVTIEGHVKVSALR